MLADGGRGTLLLELICGDEYRPFIPPALFMPPLFIPSMLRGPRLPAFGGRGTERAPIALVAGRELLNAAPRLVLLIAPPGRATFELNPLRAEELNDPRFGVDMRLTTGLENACAGGTAALAPVEPIMLALVGPTPSECIAVIRLIWLGATRILLCATESEFTNVFRETAVNPPGRLMFA
jgi:hypothetical protein